MIDIHKRTYAVPHPTKDCVELKSWTTVATKANLDPYLIENLTKQEALALIAELTSALANLEERGD